MIFRSDSRECVPCLHIDHSSSKVNIQISHLVTRKLIMWIMEVRMLKKCAAVQFVNTFTSQTNLFQLRIWQQVLAAAEFVCTIFKLHIVNRGGGSLCKLYLKAYIKSTANCECTHVHKSNGTCVHQKVRFRQLSPRGSEGGGGAGAGRAIKLSTQYFCWQQYGKSHTATDTITTISTI